MLRDTSPMIIHTTNPPAIPVQMWLNSEVLILLLWELTQLDKERKEQTFIPTWYRFSRNACYLKYAVALYSNHFSLNRAEHLYVSPAHWRGEILLHPSRCVALNLLQLSWTILWQTYIIESVDSICKDSADTQYMLIQTNLSKSPKQQTYKPL